ncbi:MAG: energy transducer TonB [Flavobacteriaceae bacterium]|nr:energy transducer TonB [Flavobacteriaceae bacterium]
MKKTISLILLLVTIAIYSQENERPIEFITVETPPVYSGCEKLKSASNKKACSTKRLMKHINDNFDMSVSEKTSLGAGQYNVYTSFVVDKDGKTTNIKTKGNDYKPFVDEAIRLIKSIPQYKLPGVQRGKIVKVRFNIPIAFIVEIEEQ